MNLKNKIKIFKFNNMFLKFEYLYILCYLSCMFFLLYTAPNINTEKLPALFVASIILSFPLMVLSSTILFIFKKYIDKNCFNEINKLNENNIKIFTDYIVNYKQFNIIIDSYEKINVKSWLLLLDNQEIFKEILNKSNLDNDFNIGLYNVLEKEINEENKNIESLILLFSRINNEKLVELKRNIFVKYEKKKHKLHSINEIINSNLNILEQLYILSNFSIDELMFRIDLIKNHFKENHWIIFDIFKLMPRQKQLECLNNEMFSIYIKDMYESDEAPKNMYDIYFKELCLIVKNEEHKEYYSVLSYIFKDAKEEEIKSIQYRSNTLADINVNRIENKQFKIIEI